MNDVRFPSTCLKHMCYLLFLLDVVYPHASRSTAQSFYINLSEIREQTAKAASKMTDSVLPVHGI